MIEDVAKTKWCPMVRCSNNNGSAANKWDNLIGKEVMCITSRCMMWRWIGEQYQGCDHLGYCGLGGKE